MTALISAEAWLRPWRTRPGGLAVCLALLIGAGSAIAKPDQLAVGSQSIDVTAVPIDGFSRTDPNQTRFGVLRWRGGIVLSSQSPAFGGYSGLALTDHGQQLMAISDAGTWLKATIGWRGGKPRALADASIGPLLDKNGKALAKGHDRDAEGLAIIDDGRAALISFERNIRIMRYPLKDGALVAPTGKLPLPAAALMLKPNTSLESVAVLAGPVARNAVVAFAEGSTDSAGHQLGWLLPATKSGGWGKPIDIRLAQHGAFQVTDLAALPDGGLIVLWRSYSIEDGIRMRLERVSADQIEAALRSGHAIDAELLFEADNHYDIDNMEGVAVSQSKTGETLLTLISDNNFSWLQRTILLQFSLGDGPETAQP